MKPLTCYLPTVAVAGLALGVGVVHGLATDRWRTSPDLESALRRLDAVPLDVGDWKGTDIPYEAEDFARAGIKGAVMRTYKNSRTGSVVSVLLVCGRGGPISVHTPDVCYAGSGYEAVGVQEKKAIGLDPGGEPVQFYSLQFAKPNPVVPTRLEIYWAWSDGSLFEAPDNPRWAYARAPAVYKLYVVREFAPTSRALKDNPTEQFIRSVLPEFRAVLARAG